MLPLYRRTKIISLFDQLLGPHNSEYLLNLKPLAVQVSITSLLASAALRHKSLLFSGLNNGLAAYKAARAFNAKAA